MAVVCSDDFFRGVPRGKAHRQWFLRHVEVAIRRVEPDISPAMLRDLKSWFSDHSCEFLRWLNSLEFHGGRFAAGHWVINPESLRASVPEAMRSVALMHVGCVDEWLHLFAAGKLPLEAAKEPGFADLALTSAQRSNCEQARLRLLTQGPRCRTCGERFKPVRSQTRNCVSCRAKRREGRASRATRGSGTVTAEEGRTPRCEAT